MEFSFRNPFTPHDDEVFEPVVFLQRVIDFREWDHMHPITHLPSCAESRFRQLMASGMCCPEHLHQCLEGELLDLAQVRSGLAVEPVGFRLWIEYAQLRLKELESGEDHRERWNAMLVTERNRLYAWIFDEKRDRERSPGYSLNHFRRDCRLHNFTPDFDQLSRAFYDTPESLREFFAEPEEVIVDPIDGEPGMIIVVPSTDPEK